MLEKTCSTCQCNKVCDHNEYGFENCGNYIPADVAPRAEVARIFEEIDSTIDLICAMTGIDIAFFGKYAELKKKYTEDTPDGKRTDH